MDKQESETQVPIESEFNKLNISDKTSNQINSSHKNCSYCNKPFTEELWCKECDPYDIIEGWTSGNPDIDKFIKDTMYDARYHQNYKCFLEWVPFDRFTDINQIGEGGFSKVYSATWLTKSKKIVLKRLNGSQKMSSEYLNEVYLYLLDMYFFVKIAKIFIVNNR